MKRITRIIRPIICMVVLLFAMTTAVMGCYPLPESCFWRLSNFFEKFFVLGESFFDFLYLYK